MQIKELTKQQISDFFTSDPNLMYLGLSDEEIVVVYMSGAYPVNDTSTYLGFYREDELIGMAKFERFTTEAVNLHIYIRTIHQHQNITMQIKKVLTKYLLENTSYIKALIMTPDLGCQQIHDKMEKLGFSKEGHITKCFKWRTEEVGIIIYGLDLRE